MQVCFFQRVVRQTGATPAFIRPHINPALFFLIADHNLKKKNPQFVTSLQRLHQSTLRLLLPVSSHVFRSAVNVDKSNVIKKNNLGMRMFAVKVN